MQTLAKTNPNSVLSKRGLLGLIHGGFVYPFKPPVMLLVYSPLLAFWSGGFLFLWRERMMDEIRIPSAWLAEVRVAYDQYLYEWRREETERALETGESPEPAQAWSDFFVDYLYAELAASVGAGDSRDC
jgi:hypothetical protein